MNFNFSSEGPKLLRTVAERLALPVYCVREGRFAYVNARFCTSFGYEGKEVLAFDSVTQVLPDDQRVTIEQVLRQRDAGDAAGLRFCTTIRCKDGTLMDAEVHESIVDHAGDRILIGVVIKAHPASRRAFDEHHFRTLTENVSEVIAVVGSEGVLQYLSPSVGRCLGYEAADLIGTLAGSHVHADDRQRWLEGLSTLLHEEWWGPVELRFQHRSGSWRVLEVVGRNRLHDAQIHGLVLNLRDVSDRRRMEHELAHFHQLAGRDRLSVQVAHELDDVLTCIQTPLDVMSRDSEANGAWVQHIDAINASVSRGKRITTEILKIVGPARSEPLPVGDLLRKLVEEIRPMLPDTIRVDLVLSPSPPVIANALLLSQAFVNLALNARDAMPGGGRLTIEASLTHASHIGGVEPFIHFRVRDTGAGIAAADLPHVFEPLFTTKNRATGLGLSIVAQIVALHGGSIWVESEKGRGTTIDFLLPAKTTEPAAGDADSTT